MDDLRILIARLGWPIPASWRWSILAIAAKMCDHTALLPKASRRRS